MNKIKTITASLLVACSLSSCMEDADVTGYLSENKREELAQTNPDDIFSAAMTGMYSDLQSYYATNLQHNYFGQKSFDYLTSLMGNDMIMTNRFGMSIYHYLCDYWGKDYAPTANRWKEYYNHIANANKILKLIPADDTNETRLKYRATALAFRGYAYLHLSYLYQYPYYMGADDTAWGKGATYDWSQAPSVPLILEDTEGDQPRSTVAKVHEQIIKDLKESCDIFETLDMTHTSASTDVDGTVAAMYLARAYMLSHQWDEALKYAQVVIDNYPVLRGEDQILQGFSSTSLPDVVFGCDITADNSTVYMSWFSQMDAYGDGYAGIGVWRAGFGPFVDKIADTDLRLKWFNCDRTTGVDDGKGGRITLIRDTPYPAPVEYQSVKFIGAGRDAVKAAGGSAAGWELGDYIYLRSEEAYLMKAEILAHKNDPDAVNVLNDFMKTRQPDYNYTFTDKASLIKEINFQKRVEFWGEGQEYLDNRRLNIPVDRTTETYPENNNHFRSAQFKLEQESRNFRYQIPTSEIENNKMINEEDQNK